MKKIFSFILSGGFAAATFAQITPTDYTQQSNWAAGKMKGILDMSFNPTFSIISPDTLSQNVVAVNYDSTTTYDLFLVYPTVLVNTSTSGEIQPINIFTKTAADIALVLGLTPAEARSLAQSEAGALGRGESRIWTRRCRRCL